MSAMAATCEFKSLPVCPRTRISPRLYVFSSLTKTFPAPYIARVIRRSRRIVAVTDITCAFVDTASRLGSRATSPSGVPLLTYRRAVSVWFTEALALCEKSCHRLALYKLHPGSAQQPQQLGLYAPNLKNTHLSVAVHASLLGGT